MIVTLVPPAISPALGDSEAMVGGGVGNVISSNCNHSVIAGGFYNKKIRTDDDLDLVGTSLLIDLDAAAVLVTRGEEGMTLFEPRKKPRHFPTRSSEVYDVTGAGDTVISVLGAGLAAGATLCESIELANAAAGIVIRELGTAAASPEELEGAFA